MAKPEFAAAPILNLTSMGLRSAMPNAHLAANEPAYHAVSVWRHFCTARYRAGLGVATFLYRAVQSIKFVV